MTNIIEDFPPTFELSNHKITESINSIFQKEKFAKNELLSHIEIDELKTFVTKLAIQINQHFDPTQLTIDRIDQDFEKLPKLYKASFWDIRKKDIDKFPPFFQLLLLLEYLHYTQKKGYLIKLRWLMIAILLAIRFEAQGFSSYYKNLILRFKLAIFSPSDTYQWLWQFLPSDSFEQIRSVSLKNIIFELVETLNAIASEYINDVLNTISPAKRLKRAKQLTTVATMIEISFYPKRRKKAERKEKQRDKEQERQVKQITQEEKQLKKDNRVASLADQATQANFVSKPYYSPYPVPDSTDIEYQQPIVRQQYFLPKPAKNSVSDGLPMSFEEQIDTADFPVIAYDKPAHFSIRYSVPLQQTELSLQQIYLSRGDFRFNSDTRLLSGMGYQQVFNRLLFDALQNDEQYLLEKRCASILLLSFITAMPIQTLLQPHFIRTSSLFDIKKTQVNLVYQLGITKRKNTQEQLSFENDTDWIKLPLPVWLVHFLVYPKNLSTVEAIQTYLAKLKEQIGLPYLSINRIETALEAVLSRYIAGSNTHLTALICRTPAPDEPAMFYSSHRNSELLAHYQNALAWLDTNGSLDLKYFNRYQENTVGSGFALTLQTVKNLISKLQSWVLNVTNTQMLFNRFSAYNWLVLCLLTGIRPNNALSNIQDIDLDFGWLQVCDKPNKNLKNHRLVPLCDSLIEHLLAYQRFLGAVRLKNLHKPELSRTLAQIHGDEMDVTLLNLINDTYDRLVSIKRGDMYQMLKEFIDLSPYWTRHFVRTQLEKNNVPIHLINSVIGHEKTTQEALGKYSSTSNQQIHAVSQTFQKIAVDLQLDQPQSWLLEVQQKLNRLFNS